MKLALVRACTRSACFELQNNTCYTAPAPFRVQLNGQTVLEACCTNVFSVFSLEPGKTYHLKCLPLMAIPVHWTLPPRRKAFL